MSVPFRPNESVECPHCRTTVHLERAQLRADDWEKRTTVEEVEVSGSKYSVTLILSSCPRCERPVLCGQRYGYIGAWGETLNKLLWPESGGRKVPDQVEEEDADLAADFREAIDVLPKSKKACAALARRCLERILSTRGGADQRNLAGKIEAVVDDLPDYLATDLDAVRQVGNFAAHPKKSKQSGKIVDVEEGEAEWILDVLEALFQHYYVGPAESEKRRERLNEKLEEIGKPPLRTPDG